MIAAEVSKDNSAVSKIDYIIDCRTTRLVQIEPWTSR